MRRHSKSSPRTRRWSGWSTFSSSAYLTASCTTTPSVPLAPTSRSRPPGWKNSPMRLLRYLGYRLLLALPVVAGIAVLNFFLIHLAPGGAPSVLGGESGAATPEYMETLRHKFGLDQSLGAQFLTYLSNMAHFNLGYSYRNDADVSSLILERLGPTSLLMLTAFGTALALGITLGLVAATG